MKKFITSLLTFLLLISSSFIYGQNENALLWKISGNGLEKPSYIFGTIHMICEEDYFFTENIEEALNKSEVLVTEINFGNMQEMMLMQSMLQTDLSLKERTTKEQFEKLEKLLKDKLDIDIVTLDKISDSGIASIITMQAFKCNVPKMYEMELLQKAMQQKKQLNGLETIKEQMKIMQDHLNIEASIKMLEEIDTDSDSNDEMITLYKEQKIDELLELLKKSSYMNPKAYDEFVSIRNNNWVNKMPEMMKNTTLFFAVGAAHLGGKDGVLELLRTKGYRIESVK